MPINQLTVSRAEAQTMVEAALAAAAEAGELVSAAVVDAGGHLVAFGRMDGTAPLTIECADGKARAAQMLRASLSEHLELLARLPPQISMSLASVDGIIMMPGALPVMVGDVCIAGMGISGGTRDGEFAQAGIDAAFGAVR